MPLREKMLRLSLGLGVAVPLLYFGIQLVAAPFYPGYSFVGHAASDLGSPQSAHPTIFNLGAILMGCAGLLAAYGVLFALLRIGSNVLLAALVALGVLLQGLSGIWAGLFPLPEPRHGSNPFTPAMLLLPVLFALVLWKQRDARRLKIYLVLTNMLLLVLFPIMSGIVAIDIAGYQGLLQRMVALVFFPPVGVVSFYLLRHMNAEASDWQAGGGSTLREA